MRKLRKLPVAALLSGGAVVTMASPAPAHVHLFTPLGCLTTDNANSGAAVGFEMAADQAGPLQGGTPPIIPLNASGKLPSGGQGAANACG
jgi:hypothetical protein